TQHLLSPSLGQLPQGDTSLSISDPTEVRLVNGSNRCSGRVEVLHNQRWGSVCDDGWDLDDAQVVCRQLGCGTAVAAQPRAQFGMGYEPIWLDDVNCTGAEAALSECRARPWGESNCDHREDASVVCLGCLPRPISDPMPLRLVNGSSLCAGRVEVLHRHQWGTVCDDSWDEEDAMVVCRQLGCGTVVSALGAAQFGQGRNAIWLDDVNCTGREDALSECLASPWGTHNCDHGKDAGVVCSDLVASQRAPLRLSDGPHRCAGRVEVFYKNQWGTVCDDHWDLENAGVVCRQLGCGTAVSAPVAGHFGAGSGPIWLDDVSCMGSEVALSYCRSKGWGKNNCHHGEDAGVVCSAGPAELRLVNGPNRCSGRVEVMHDHQWGTVCDDDWSFPDASVVCRQLGCGTAVSAYGAAHFGRGSGPIWLDNVQCSGTEGALSECLARPWGVSNCDHGEDASVVCTGNI
ncbi:DMBT1 protein, partial [Himantopus himantopus]|nr:DMBT1 protein [Himantopus himantopus]